MPSRCSPLRRILSRSGPEQVASPSPSPKQVGAALVKVLVVDVDGEEEDEERERKSMQFFLNTYMWDLRAC